MKQLSNILKLHIIIAFWREINSNLNLSFLRATDMAFVYYYALCLSCRQIKVSGTNIDI